MNKAVIYTRVSSEEQVKNTSLDSQEKICRNFAEQQGYEVIGVYCEEGETAKVADRPKLIEMMNYCTNSKNDVSTVIVYKVDRIARNQYDHLTIRRKLQENDVTFHSATEPIGDDPMGKAIEGILMVFAELDNAIKSERTKEALKSIVEEEGRYPHKAPFGYLNYEKENEKKDIKPDSEIAPLITTAFEDYSKACYSLKEIAKIFSSREIKGPRGGNIDSQFIKKMLHNEFYIGEKYEYGASKVHVKFNHEPIVSKNLFYEVQQVLSMRSNNTNKPRTIFNIEFPLRQFMQCHECENYMTGYYATGRGGKKFPYYKCYNKECSNNKSYSRGEIHELFMSYLQEFLPSEESGEKFKQSFLKEWERLQTDASDSITFLEKKLKKLQEEKKHISQLAKSGVYTPEEAREELELSRNEIMITEIALNDAKTDHIEAEVVIDAGLKMFRNIPSIWRNADIEEKSRLQFALFPEGVIYEIKSFSNRRISPCIGAIRSFEANDRHMG